MNFYENIKYLVENKKRITLTEMVKILNLSTSMPSKWKDGTIPNGETLIKLADFLDESVDCLLGRNETKKDSLALNYGESPTKYKIKELIDTILEQNNNEEELNALRIVLEKFVK